MLELSTKSTGSMASSKCRKGGTIPGSVGTLHLFVQSRPGAFGLILMASLS